MEQFQIILKNDKETNPTVYTVYHVHVDGKDWWFMYWDYEKKDWMIVSGKDTNLYEFFIASA